MGPLRVHRYPDEPARTILRRMLRVGFVYWALLLVPQAWSQPFLFDRLTTAEGLPGDRVNALFEDRDGFMWAGTEEGLARLEGSRVRVFQHDPNDARSLAHDQVNGIAQSANGTLWFATMNGLSRSDGHKGDFINERVAATGALHRQANRMRQVIALGDSLLWVVTEAGLYRYDIPRGAFIAMQGRGPGSGPHGMIDASSALHWDAERQTLWAGTHKGMAAWDARTDAWTDHRNGDGPVWSDSSSTDAPVVHTGTLYFLRNKPYTLFGYDLRSGELHTQPDVEATPNHFTLRCQSFDADGRHWLATWTHRLFVREPDGPWQELKADGVNLAPAHVECMLRTRSGEQWLGNDNGIAVLRRGAGAFRLLTHDMGTASISAMRTWGTDTLLIGTAGGGVRVCSVESGNCTALHSHHTSAVDEADPKADHIHGFGESSGGTVLLTTGKGLLELDPRAPTLRPAMRLMDAIKRGRERSYTVAEEAGGVLWLGTWSSGLWRYDPGTGSGELIDTVEGRWGRLPGRFILCWLRGRDGTMWLGLNNGGGLARMNAGRWEPITDSAGTNIGGVVRTMVDDKNGDLWLGTHEQGIVRYSPRTGHTRYYTRRDGLPGVCVLALRCSRNGTLWVVTTKGIAYRPPGAQDFLPLALPQSVAAQAPSKALVELPDGRLILGVGSRLLMYDPGAASASEPLMPVFTAHRLNDSLRLGLPSGLTLTADRKLLTLELGGLHASPGHAPLFRYRIEPRDTAWAELGAVHRLDLFDLPAGDHTIALQASLDGATWSPVIARAAVTVLPPFYATWWFRGLSIATFLLLLFIAFRLYMIDRLRKQREAFERQQAVLTERMRIAGDMHDDLGAGLSALKLRSEMALRVEKDPAKREQLGSLAKTAGELIGSMRQIIWTMNTDQSSLADLASYTASYVRNYCAENGLAVEVNVPAEWPSIHLTSEQRRNIFLVVKEAAHNIVKHANASLVRFTMSMGPALSVEVRDNGAGLPISAQETVGNGLRNMRKRILVLGGELRAERPGIGSGTSIRFVVPLRPPNQGSIGRNGATRDIRGT